MRIPNKYISKIVVWSVSGSLITNSCTIENIEPNVADLDYDVRDLDSFSNIEISLLEEEIEYINYLHQLTHDLISNPKVAKDFSTNHNKFFSMGKITVNPIVEDLEPALKKIVLALSDEEVLEAIELKDSKRYILTLYEKGYIETKVNDMADYLSTEDKTKILKSIGYSEDEILSGQHLAVGVFVAAFLFVALCVSHAAIMYTAIGAVNIGVGMTVIYSLAAVTDVRISGIEYHDLFDDRSWDIWILKDDLNSTVATSQEMEDITKGAIDAYKIIYNLEFSNHIENRLLNTIALNTEKEHKKIIEKQI